MDNTITISEIKSRGMAAITERLRAAHGLKTPDCLQAASCLQRGQDHVFVTEGAALQRVVGLQVLHICDHKPNLPVSWKPTERLP